MIRDLEVRHCRALVAVHEGGGIGAAARALGVAQSTVSETLSSLERLVGVPMTLRRAGREAVLSAGGEAMLPHARSLIAASEAALAVGKQPGQATIKLGTVESISSYLLPGPLGAFRRHWPGADVRIAIGLCEDLRKRVTDGDLDAALTIEGASSDDDNDLALVALRLVVAPHHALASKVVAPRDLAGRTALLSDAEGAFNKLVYAWLGDTAHPPRLESAGSVEGVKRGVLAGAAIGVLPNYAVADELSAGTLIALRSAVPLPCVALRLTTLRPLPQGSPLASLIEHVRKTLPAD
ncbi:LysR family transcriptional regulator [Allosphingosinicella vermicomposti]|uniref:LysR family transcriptional regulator n=1 Tax=Allosphingosinicella vermicomposti TaxID=614671 RepID=UPI00131A4F8E|nr:LysR family transcriptional regulator [Allosphingosinicella vermicomposti]